MSCLLNPDLWIYITYISMNLISMKKNFFSNIRVLYRKNTDTFWNDFFLLQSVYTSLVVILNFIIIIALKIIFMHQKSFKLKSFRFYFISNEMWHFIPPYVVPLNLPHVSVNPANNLWRNNQENFFFLYKCSAQMSYFWPEIDFFF